MKITFWQNMLSPHQSAFLRALAGHPRYEVTLVVEEVMPKYRAESGWSSPSFGSARVVVAPDAKDTERLLSDDAVHVINGFRRPPRLHKVAHLAARRGLRYGIITERPDTEGWKGRLRKYLYRYEGWFHAERLDFILAMGSLGVHCFSPPTFRPKMLFPFGYVTETAVPAAGSDKIGPAGLFRFIYLGRLSPAKGVSYALRAIADFRGCAELIIVGGGALEPALRQLARDLDLESGVRFHGMCPSSVALEHLSNSDCLVLPSLHDGWGAVVNEALLLGVPVICTDACGAKDLIAEPWLGEVCAAGDVASLSGAMQRMIEQGKRDYARSERIRSWAQFIDGEALAEYFADILRCVYEGGPRPSPPWSSSPVLQSERVDSRC